MADNIAVPGGEPGVVDQADILLSLFEGLKANFRMLFQLNNVSLDVGERHLEALLRDNNATTPRGSIIVTNVEVLKTHNNVTMRRSGYTGPERSLKEQTVSVATVYPVTVSLEYHHIVKDALTAMKFISTVSTLIASNSFHIKIDILDQFRYQTKLDFDPNVVMPRQNFVDTAAVGNIDVAVSGRVNGYVGRIDDLMRVIKVDFPVSVMGQGETAPRWIIDHEAPSTHPV